MSSSESENEVVDQLNKTLAQSRSIAKRPRQTSITRNISPNVRGLAIDIDDEDDEVTSLNRMIDGETPVSTVTYAELKQRVGLSKSNYLSPKASTSFGDVYQRVRIDGASDIAPEDVCERLNAAMELRRKYQNCSKPHEFIPHRTANVHNDPVDIFFTGPVPVSSNHQFEMVNGVVKCWDSKLGSDTSFEVWSVQDFYRDLASIMRSVFDGPTKSFCFGRLKLLDSMFTLHLLLNQNEEMDRQKAVAHRDFYNVRKVDNHVHHSACMNQKHLLRFMKKKLKTEGDTLAIVRDNRTMTLREVFDSLNLSAYDLNIDALDMHAHQETFHRFDKFNLKYNPIGESRLREIFLKTDNFVNGRFLAEITSEVFADLEANKYQFAEYRLSIYGRSDKDWTTLAKWVYDHRLASKNVRWMIQIPRLYNVYKKIGIIESFQDIIDHIFLPLFAVSVDPSSDVKLHHFLKLIVGFDTVDDESVAERSHYLVTPIPEQWTSEGNPMYSMWAYYLYANLQVLNQLRASKNMNTFTFRPHAGEAGDLDHLATAYLLADGIAHGLMLSKAPVLQYLYYLMQIGISMSPLSNNLLFVQYDRNPFVKYFSRGLNVTLSSDDPLLIHFTKEPLLEEYSVAAQVWKLSSVDMCEIARNSVLQSGFEERYKKHWLGENYALSGDAGNSIKHTNVPDIRVLFRRGLYDAEIALICGEKTVVDEFTL